MVLVPKVSLSLGNPVWVPKVSLSLDMKLSPLGTMAASKAGMSSTTLYEHHLGSL